MADNRVTWQFLEHTGDNRVVTQTSEELIDGRWHLESRGSNGDVHTLLLNEQLDTLEWHYVSSERAIDYRVVRDGRRLIISGTMNGKSVDRVLEIGDSRWYQAMEKSLERMAAAPSQDQARFVTVQPFDLSILRLVARKRPVERVDVAEGQSFQAVRIEVTFDSLLSLFWSSNYWFRVSDHRFIKYEGVRGGPGTPVTRVDFQRVVSGSGS